MNPDLAPETTRLNPAAIHPTPGVTAPGRLTSMDAYRGFVMFLMMAEVLRVSRVARVLPGAASGVSSRRSRATSNGWGARCTT